MKLPRRGCLVRADGTVVWAWEHNDPTTEFDVLPPYTTVMETGDVRHLARPDDMILDMESVTAPGDIPLLYNDMLLLQVERTTGGTYCFKQRFTDSAGSCCTMDHPVMARINARRRLNKQSPLPSTPDRIISQKGV